MLTLHVLEEISEVDALRGLSTATRVPSGPAGIITGGRIVDDRWNRTASPVDEADKLTVVHQTVLSGEAVNVTHATRNNLVIENENLPNTIRIRLE